MNARMLPGRAAINAGTVLHRLRWHVIGQASERCTLDDLYADEVKRPVGRTRSGESGNDAAIIGDHTAVLRRLGIRDDSHRDERTRFAVRVDKTGYIDVGKRVAVDDEESEGWRASGSARRDRRRSRGRHLPRVADAHPSGAPSPTIRVMVCGR
jgi:hypothetical protein